MERANFMMQEKKSHQQILTIQNHIITTARVPLRTTRVGDTMDHSNQYGWTHKLSTHAKIYEILFTSYMVTQNARPMLIHTFRKGIMEKCFYVIVPFDPGPSHISMRNIHTSLIETWTTIISYHPLRHLSQ